MCVCCEVQGQGRGQGHGESRVPDAMHNDVTETVQGSPSDVISTQYSTANSDVITNANG